MKNLREKLELFISPKSRSSVAIKILLFSLSFLFANTAKSQPVITNEIEVKHLEKLLTNNTVTSIFQDKAGFIWFGTFNGLNKYDGVAIKKYYSNQDDDRSLTNFYIQKIAGDHLGNVWVATSNGLNRYAIDYDNFSQYRNNPNDRTSVTSGTLTDILFDSKERLWIIGDGVSLYDFENDKFINFELGKVDQQIVRAESTNHIYQDQRGRIWFLYFRDIYFYSEEDNTIELFFDGYSNPLSSSPWYFMHMIQINEDDFWISTNNAGIFKVKPYKSDSLVSFSEFTGIDNSAFRNVQLLQLFKDSKDRIWITPENKGIYVFNNQAELLMRFINDRDDNQTIAFNSIWSVYEDNINRIWIGTWQSGVDIIDQYYRKFKHYEYKPGINSLSHNIVRDIIEDQHGNLYISTDGGGLNYFNRQNGTFTSFNNIPNEPFSLSTNATLPLEFDNDNRLWIGTWNGGINKFNPESKNFDHYTPSNSGLNSPHIFDIENDGNGNMYCATWGGGLSFFNVNTNSWKTFRHDADDNSSICSDYIFSLYFDSNKNLWIGTVNGLDLLKPSTSGNERFIHYYNIEGDSTSISDNSINTIYEDLDNQIWIGTVAGLNNYNPKDDSFIRIDKNQGLIDDNVNCILQDPSGHYWLGTNKGLIRFNNQKKEFRNYDISDGMQGYEYSRNAALELSSGEFALGGTKGLNIFHPDEIKENPYIPQIVFTDFKIFNESVPIGDDSPLKEHISKTKEIKLNHLQNVFSIEFVALSYTHPEKNQYAYLMEGFDQDWIKVINQQRATYTNLKPGRYIFRVKASNNDGIWNEEGISIAIKILPPWWATIWFRISSACLLLMLVVAVYVARTRKHKQTRELLESRIREATDDINLRNQKLQEAQSKIKTIVDDVKNNLGAASAKLLTATSSQASTITGISSSIEQIVQDVSQNSKEASDIFNQAKIVKADATKSIKTIEDAVEFIRLISKEISIIFEIAQQTKILSINASIEAARAGESGKSFSEVAKEVKKLSERSQSVAENIIHLSSSGLKLSNEANKIISDLVGFINSIVDLIANISMSSQDQSGKANNINMAVQEMSSYISETSQLVQDLDYAIKSLSINENQEN